MKTIYTINTINNFMDMIYRPFAEPFLKEHADTEMFNIMDDSLLHDTRKYGGMTPVIAKRMYHYCAAAEGSGADGILVTCTSVNAATAMIRPMLGIPILNIEEPVAEMAVENGAVIGVLATLPTSPAAIGRVMEEKAHEKGKSIRIVESVADGAFDVLCAGNRQQHDEMVCEALYRLAKEVDVIAFAQISMSLIPHEPVKVPVYKIGESGFLRIRELTEQGGGYGAAK